jgi:hypothetical protein
LLCFRPQRYGLVGGRPKESLECELCG